MTCSSVIFFKRIQRTDDGYRVEVRKSLGSQDPVTLETSVSGSAGARFVSPAADVVLQRALAARRPAAEAGLTFGTLDYQGNLCPSTYSLSPASEGGVVRLPLGGGVWAGPLPPADATASRGVPVGGLLRR